MRRIAADGDCDLERSSLFKALDSCYDADLRASLRRAVSGNGEDAPKSPQVVTGPRRMGHGGKAISSRVSDEEWEYWTMKAW